MASTISFGPVAITADLILIKGHGSPSTPFSNHPEEISRRQLETNARHVLARNCASQVAEYQAQRKARRDLRRRGVAAEDGPMDLNKRQTKSSDLSSVHPATQNTCVGAPEVMEGPYYLRNDLVRTDLREGQAGTPLYLDIGVLDITTCSPVTNAFVEIWACNAQGKYSGFLDAPPLGPPPPGGAAPPGGFNIPKTDESNFLRGGHKTDADGIVGLSTIFPGFYSGRAIHIHTMIHQNIHINHNGTFTSESGSLRHIGQIFFDEDLNKEVIAQKAYQGSGESYTPNSKDELLAQENSGGNNAYAEVMRHGNTLSDGLLGYITIGIDTRAKQSVSTKNYYGPVEKGEEED